MPKLTKEEADFQFRYLVVSGIWMLARLILHANKTITVNWRADAIVYFDDQGNQSDGAKDYRRNNTFPPFFGDH